MDNDSVRSPTGPGSCADASSPSVSPPWASIPIAHRHVATLRITATDEGWDFIHRVFVNEAEIPGISIRCVAIGDVFAEQDVLEDALKDIEFGEVSPCDAADYAEAALDRGQAARGNGCVTAQGIDSRKASETVQQARPEGQEPGPKDAPESSVIPPTTVKGETL